MPDAITTAMIKQYSDNVDYIVQQKGSRLRRSVREESVKGEESYFDQVGPAPGPTKIVARHEDTPLHDMPQARRKVVTYPYVYATLLDKQDQLRVAIDAQSAYVQNAAWTMARAIDDALIAAANGTAYTGKDGTTSTVLPTTNRVAVASSGLTVAKILAAKELLDAADVDEDDPRFMWVTAAQITDLLNTTEVKSSDYNTVKALAAGQINSFCGFEFIRSQRLAVCLAGTDRGCIAFAKSGILLAVQEEVVADIAPRKDKNNAIQIYYRMDIGATRMSESKVVEIACAE